MTTTKKKVPGTGKTVELTHDGSPLTVGASDKVISVTSIGRHTAVVIACRTYRDADALDIRQIRRYEDDNGDERWNYQGKGVWIPADVVNEILDAICANADAIRDRLEL